MEFLVSDCYEEHFLVPYKRVVMVTSKRVVLLQVHLRRVMHKDRFIRNGSIVQAIGNRDLIHNPLHLIFSVDVLGMTSSTLASISKGFSELSTDGQFMQLRAKQVWSRRITGVGDAFVQGTEALAQGVAFGVSGVVVESARQNGILGFAHGVGRALLGFVVQPVSGALDFFSLTVDGIGASCSRCLEVLSNRTALERIRNPRAVHSDGILREYDEKEVVGHVPLLLILLWDVPWEELMALELPKAGSQRSHLILHLKNFRKSESFAHVIKCSVPE